MRNFLWGKDIVKWKIRSLVWHLTWILSKSIEKGPKPKVQKQKMYKVGDMLSQLTLLKRLTDRGLGTEPPATGQIFVILLEKKAILIPMDSISHVFRAI